MSTETLKANKDWLVWARKSVHYDKETVAKKMRISPDVLDNLENTGEITYSQLKELSKIYKISSHLFFSESQPTYEKSIPDFRTINSKKIDLTPKIMFELRRARERRETLLNLIEDLDDEIIPVTPFINTQYNTIQDVSKKIREILSINRTKISTLKLGDWIKSIESLGILVFEFYDIEPEELRGYALYYNELPIIGINHRESDNAKKFTLFHELAHLFLKKEGISNINEFSIKNKDEFICNQIAAEVLVPSDMFRNLVEDYSIDKFRQEDIQHLAKILNVSKYVIVRKALDLNYITPSIYSSRIDEFNNYINPPKKKRNTTSNHSKKGSESKIDHSKQIHKEAKIALNKNGEYFIHLLFKAYDENLISDLDVALELDVSLGVLDELINIIWEAESL